MMPHDQGDIRAPDALSRSQERVTELQEQVTELAAQRAAISEVLRAL